MNSHSPSHEEIFILGKLEGLRYRPLTYSNIENDGTYYPLSGNHCFFVYTNFFNLGVIKNGSIITFINCTKNISEERIISVEKPIIEIVIIDGIPTKIVRFVPVEYLTHPKDKIAIFTEQCVVGINNSLVVPKELFIILKSCVECICCNDILYITNEN
jgi:hypothetical protein